MEDKATPSYWPKDSIDKKIYEAYELWLDSDMGKMRPHSDSTIFGEGFSHGYAHFQKDVKRLESQNDRLVEALEQFVDLLAHTYGPEDRQAHGYQKHFALLKELKQPTE